MLQKQPSVFELVPGYGEMLSQRQLDEALDNSANSPTHLINVFFLHKGSPGIF